MRNRHTTSITDIQGDAILHFLTLEMDGEAINREAPNMQRNAYFRWAFKKSV